MIALRYLVTLLVLLAAPSAEAEQADKSSYILFVHTGADPKVTNVDDKVRAVLTNLLKAGYSVRKPDTDRDVVGGPGVDYFNDSDRDTAADVAKIVNETYQGMDLTNVVLKARLQKVQNPQHYLGVWLF